MPKTVQDWQIEIDNALNYRRQFGGEDAWKKLEYDYLNDPQGDTAIGPNLVYSMGDALMSALNVPDPEVVVQPTHPNGVDRAPIVESVDNWFIKKLKMKREVDMATLHAYLYSRAIMKIGYDSEFGWSPFYDIGDSNNLLGMTLTQFDKKGNRIEFMDTTPGMPWTRSVSPHDIVVPWGTTYIDEAPWVAHRVIRLNKHLKADPKYKNTDRLSATISMEAFIKSYMSMGSGRHALRQYAKRSAATGVENMRVIYNEIWEIHDREDGKVKVIAFDHDKFLRDEVDIVMMACGMPFVSGTFIQHPRTFWSTPLAYYLGQIQATQFDVSKQAEKQRRISNLKFIATKKFMSPDQLNKLISADVGAIGIADTTGPLKDQLMAFPQGNMLDFVVQSEAHRRDARDAIGMSRNQVGEFDASSRRTAREVATVNQGSERRQSKREGMVTGLYLDSMNKLNRLSFKLWKTKRWAMVNREWVNFTGEELDGDYLLDVGLATKRRVSRHQRQLESLMLSIQMAQLGADPAQAFEYAQNAAYDPGFERLLMLGLKNKGQQGAGGGGNQQQGLPTIPGTGG